MKTEMTGKPETEKLLGKYFQSANEDNKIEWQGMVIGEPHPGWYLVQLFEWTSGEASVQRLVLIYKMIGFCSYSNLNPTMYALFLLFRGAEQQHKYQSTHGTDNT